MERHYSKMCEMMVKRLKCLRHKIPYSFYAIKKRSLYCIKCVANFQNLQKDLVNIISLEIFLSAMCFLSRSTSCEIHDKQYKFYCTFHFDFHCLNCLESRCNNYLLELNKSILSLENDDPLCYYDNVALKNHYYDYPYHSDKYFKFFKFQLQRYKNEQNILNNTFDAKSIDFNNSRIINNINSVNKASKKFNSNFINENKKYDTPLRDDIKGREFKILGSLIEEEANLKKSAASANTTSLDFENSHQKKSEEKKFINNLSRKMNTFTSSKNNHEANISSNFAFASENKTSLNDSRVNEIYEKDIKSKSSLEDRQDKQSIFDLGNLNTHSNDKILSFPQPISENNKKIVDENFIRTNSFKSCFNNKSEQENSPENLLIPSCFFYNFFHYNKIVRLEFSLNFNSENILKSYENMKDILENKKLKRKFFVSEESNIILFERYFPSKNFIMINYLNDISTDKMFTNIKSSSENLMVQNCERNSDGLKMRQNLDDKYNYFYYYDSSTMEIKQIDLKNKQQISFFSFYTLEEDILFKIAEIISSEIFVGKNHYFEVRKADKADIINNFCNPKYLFINMEILGLTDNNFIIGLIQDRIFFRINVKNKSFDFQDIILLENERSQQKLKFFYLKNKNLERPKLATNYAISGTNKKLFYIFWDEYSDSNEFEAFTYSYSTADNIDAKIEINKNIKWEMFTIADTILTKAYLSNLKNNHTSCFFVNLREEDYVNYCNKLNKLSIKSSSQKDSNDAYITSKFTLFLVFIQENKIVKLLLNLENNSIAFFSEKILKQEKTKNFKLRKFYSNIMNYENFVLFLNEDFQILIYNFLSDDFKVIKDFI